MSLVERLKYFYDRKWVTKEKLAMYAQLGAITLEEYTEICGDVLI